MASKYVGQQSNPNVYGHANKPTPPTAKEPTKAPTKAGA